MTDDPTASVSASGNERYSSAMDIRNEHAELRRAALNDLQNPDKAATAAANIRMFIKHAQEAGGMIGDASQRKAAQAMIDYWTAELASSSEASEGDYLPTLLAPFAAQQPPDDNALKLPEDKEGKASESEEEKESREIIRLSATARLWRDADKEPGFLLVGRALEWADRHRDKDADIAILVDESRRAVRHKRTMNAIYLATGAICTCLFLFWLIDRHIPNLAQAELQVLLDTSDPKTKEASLKDLAFYERFMPASKINELHLTSLRGLDGANLEQIELYGAGFAYSWFPAVNLKNAVLPNSSFFNSVIMNSHFDDASLRYSQFRKALIQSTTFTRASLNGAVFDQAQLRNVDFSEADLRSASFKDATLEQVSASHFRNTPWWLATGWSSEAFNQLMGLKLSQDEKVLKQSKALSDELNEARGRVLKARPGTLERAAALNSVAWTLATWGVDVTAVNEGGAEAVNGACEKATDIPDNALQAASEAVCLAGKLLETTPDKENATAKANLANFQDTLGYILLQTGSTSRALGILDGATQVLDSGDVIFRYSVAQYASGKKDEAMRSLQTSMVGKRYVPSHELWRLKNLLANSEFLTCIYEYMDKQASPPRTACE